VNTRSCGKRGPIVDLNTLIPASLGATLHLATNINERGEILAEGLPAGCNDRSACGHIFLLTPCDENHPDLEGCDYDMVDGSDMPATQMPTTAKPVLSPDSIRQLMQSAGRRSKPWYRGFGAQTQPK
jgi:hypothetical protein